MIKHIPNCITILRFLLAPIICAIVFYGFCNNNITYQWIGSFLFIIAAISDFLDGFLARKLNIESQFGKCFDNIADKVLNTSLVCTLLYIHKIWLVPSLMMIFREIIISAFREYVALQGEKMDVDIYGKVKTTLQFIGLIFIINANTLEFDGNFVGIGNIIFYISAILSLISGLMYILKYSPLIYERK